MTTVQKVTLALLIVILLSGLIYWVVQAPVPPVQSTPVISPTPAVNQNTHSKMTSSNPPALTIDTSQTYQAILHTSAGDMTIEFTPQATPVTVNNFIHLAQSGFYNHTVFHRIIAGFMIQGGDPKGDGTGGPGYTFADEPITADYTRGTVAMANAGPNTNGSQFFIMHADYPLPKNYVIFGHLTAGLDTLDRIAATPTTTNAFGEKSVPVSPVTLTSVEIHSQ